MARRDGAAEARRRGAGDAALTLLRDLIEANGRRIDERFGALHALILKAIEARHAPAD